MLNSILSCSLCFVSSSNRGLGSGIGEPGASLAADSRRTVWRKRMQPASAAAPRSPPPPLASQPSTPADVAPLLFQRFNVSEPWGRVPGRAQIRCSAKVPRRGCEHSRDWGGDRIAPACEHGGGSCWQHNRVGHISKIPLRARAGAPSGLE